MVNGVFFTDLDPSQRPRGSRDPLGVQAVWVALGRPLVGNLTLTSWDVAGFRTLLLGYLLAERAAGAAERQAVFLRFEQLAAACRVLTEDVPPLGALRVRAWLAESHRYELSARNRQILGDQPGTGLWGLYQRPAMLSGLVTRDRQLTERGRQIASLLLEGLPSSWRRKVLEGDGSVVSLGGETGRARAQQVATLLRDGHRDRKLLHAALVDSERTALQPLVARLLAARADEPLKQRQRVAALGADASSCADPRGPELTRRVRLVEVAESFLAPLQGAFDLLLQEGHGRELGTIAEQLRAAWPDVPETVLADELDALLPELARAVGAERVALWSDAARAMSEAEWEHALRLAVALHQRTAASRGGAPWVRLDGPAVHVVLRKGSTLPAQDELLSGWLNPYFLPPLQSLQRSLSPALEAAA